MQALMTQGDITPASGTEKENACRRLQTLEQNGCIQRQRSAAAWQESHEAVERLAPLSDIVSFMTWRLKRLWHTGSHIDILDCLYTFWRINRF